MVGYRRRWTMAKRVSRRDVTRAVPLLMLGSAVAGLSRFLAACTSDSSSLKSGPTEPARGVPPNDQNEYVDPAQAMPVNTGDQPPTVPNQQWEARARQL